MGSDILTVVYDACTLYPLHLRNLLVQCAADSLVKAHWTEAIHDEWMRNLVASVAADEQAGLRERLLVTKGRMCDALPDAMVVNYEHRIDGINFPDRDDRHVVAAALECGATHIVSLDRHFNEASLAPYGLQVIKPGELLLSLYQQDAELIVEAFKNARRNLRRTTPTAAEYLALLRRTETLVPLCDILAGHPDAAWD